MRINGDFEEHVTREFVSRRGSIDAELARLGPRPSQSHEAVAPAVLLGADAVQISPEARAALLAKVPEAPLAQPLPSPSELVDAIRAILSPAGLANVDHLVPELAALLGRLARHFAGPMPAVTFEQPAAALAGRLVELLLGRRPIDAPRALTSEQSRQASALLRELFSLPQTQLTGGGQPTAFERVAAAILLAVSQWRGTPEEAPAGLPGATLPAALHSLAGQPAGPRQRRRRRRPPADGRDKHDERDSPGGGEPRLPYRSNPRLT